MYIIVSMNGEVLCGSGSNTRWIRIDKLTVFDKIKMYASREKANRAYEQMWYDVEVDPCLMRIIPVKEIIDLGSWGDYLAEQIESKNKALV